MLDEIIKKMTDMADAFVLAQRMSQYDAEYYTPAAYTIPTTNGTFGIVFGFGRIDIYPNNKVIIKWMILYEDKKKFEEVLNKYEFESIEESRKDNLASILYELTPKYKSVEELMEITSNLINI